MATTLFEQLAPLIRNMELSKVTNASLIPRELLIGSTDRITSHYIPFDQVNKSAKLVIVGITPGFTQWRNAMQEAKSQLNSGASLEAAHTAAKKMGAFSGALRPNLVALLNSIQINKWLNISSCESLFNADSHLVQNTSILNNPIFIDGENYNGTPSMISTPFLQQQILDFFAKEVSQMPNALYVPLGPKVSEGLNWLISKGILRDAQILHGLPHPSGANAERIAYFLGKKTKESLSSKTNPEKLDEAKKTIETKMNRLESANP